VIALLCRRLYATGACLYPISLRSEWHEVQGGKFRVSKDVMGGWFACITPGCSGRSPPWIPEVAG
jgi:hypothetical protein